MIQIPDYVKPKILDFFERGRNTSDDDPYTKFMYMWESFIIFSEAYTHKDTVPQLLEDINMEFRPKFELFAEWNQISSFHKYVSTRILDKLKWMEWGIINTKIYLKYYEWKKWVYLRNDNVKECVRISDKMHIIAQKYNELKNFHSFLFSMYQIRKNMYVDRDEDPVEDVSELLSYANPALEEFLDSFYEKIWVTQ